MTLQEAQEIIKKRETEAAESGSVQRDGSTAQPGKTVIIIGCECEGYRKGNGIWFDTQDIEECHITACPACGKPFKREVR